MCLLGWFWPNDNYRVYEQYGVNSIEDTEMVRYLDNPCLSSVEENRVSSLVTPEWLKQSISQLGELIMKRPRDEEEWSDASPYTGLSGMALSLHLASPYLGKETEKYIQEMMRRCKNLCSHRPEKQARFLAGDLGAMTVELTIKRDRKTEEHLLSLLPSILSPNFPCDELLYGRAGFLAAALWLKSVHGTDVIPTEAVRSVIEAIIQRGRQPPSSHPPLMWQWHDSEYLGAAHGIAGILHLILSFSSLLSPGDLSECMRTVDWMIEIQDSEGNFPSSSKWIGAHRSESLIHWCHGAPGVVPLLITVHTMTRNDKYVESLLRAGDLIWERGLLKKGPGICHGVAGNGYALLQIWRHTKDEKWLRRALCFSHLMLSPFISDYQRTPDSPYSLFEGWAGALCFLVDLLHPEKAQFPLYPINYAI